MQARCLLFEFQRRGDRAEAPTVGRNDFFNRLSTRTRLDGPGAAPRQRQGPSSSQARKSGEKSLARLRSVETLEMDTETKVEP